MAKITYSKSSDLSLPGIIVTLLILSPLFASFLSTFLESIINIVIMGWLDSLNPSNDSTSFWDRIATNEYIQMTPQTTATLKEMTDFSSPQLAMIGVGCTACFLMGFKAGRIRPSRQRITSVNDVTSDLIGAQAPSMRGKVLSVSDGDTLRFYHTPTIFHASSLGKDKKISEVALPVRICSIDTPEVKKFGKPGQPFGEDAQAYLGSMILGKTVNLKLLSKDQYGRAVGQISVGKIFPKYADEEMLKAGLAEVYIGGGAVYGFRGKDAYLAMEEKAKSKKKGMWALKDRESASEFKARIKKEG